MKTKGAFNSAWESTSQSSSMIQILRKQGWTLNPNDKVVNGVLKMVEKNNGECPCHNTGEDKHCPCSDYRLNDVCHCSLYVKLDNDVK